MSFAPFFSIILAVTLVSNLLVPGILLWLSARLVRINGVTWRRAYGTALILLVLQIFFAVAELASVSIQPILPLVIGLISIVVLLLVTKRMLVASLGKTLLVVLVFAVFSALYGVPVVLVLKASVAEAFVIPSGGMAETIRGYHKEITCPQCGHTFAVNASSEADPQGNRLALIVGGCTCPNCRVEIDFARFGIKPFVSGGDRILVAKRGYGKLERLQTVVFDYPAARPEQGKVRYVKRLIGMPGETVVIHGGKLYTTSALDYHWCELPDGPHDPRARLLEYMYVDDKEAMTLFEQGLRDPRKRTFQIVRKAPDLILSLGRLVYDNDSQATDLIGVQEPRWSSQDPWKPDNPKEPRRFDSSGENPDAADPSAFGWLHYHHLIRGNSKPELITDFSGYNSSKGIDDAGRMFDIRSPGPNWVSDLYLECEIRVDKPQGELRLELSRGVDRFQARFDLATGTCTLVRLHDESAKQTKEETLFIRTESKGEPEKAVRQTPLNKPGTYHLRFANVDERLVLWVDSQLPFGDGVEYEPSAALGPTVKNDLEPASIGVHGAALSVSHLKLWRDTYYTVQVNQPSDADIVALLEGRTFLPWRTMYVQLGHYLCLGDNSPESADSRAWGLVPEQMMLGPAVGLYFPFSRARFLR